MSTESTFTPAAPAASPVAVPVVPPVVAPVVAPAIETPADGAEIKIGSKAFQARLEEERVKGEKRAAEQFVASLGIPIEEARKLIADAKAKDDAQKSEVQRLTEQLAAEKARLTQFDSYKATVEGRVGIEFAALTDEQRAAVETLAGTDPALRLKTIDAMRPTWAAAKANADAAALATAKAADEAKAAAEAAAKAALPAQPANTAPPAPPAPIAQLGGPANPLAEYEAIKSQNLFMAARFYAANASKIIAAQTAAKAR